ncbi:LLM class flavin-dependent oxidoreductase [Microbacterium sp. A8/3-1]|uniref:LLM class flavin-dependent oxidoreductase n=1 Tax=Microbacterium sp. A8/3-1 TaxID=3160749 RepID=A0AAU7VVT1_9MICO
MSEYKGIELFGFIDGAYKNVPYAGDRKSNYIDLPNDYYDPIEGQHVMETQLELLESLESAGFDGAVFSEQHNGPIGLGGNPMLFGAWLAGRTSRMKIVVNGPIINAYKNPIRLAEELAMLDTMSRGRLIFGLPMGHGMQHHSVGINPATARARMAEAHDLLFEALYTAGPFEWKGDFFNVPYVNLWPKPMHRIECILPGGGSIETLQRAAKYRHCYQNALSPRPAMIKTMERFRDLCRAEGYEPDPRQSAALFNVHVAETDEQARQEVEAFELWNFQNFFRSVGHDNFPPGYVSAASIRAMRGGGYRSTPTELLQYDELLENHWLIAGSPETVTRMLQESIDELGIGRALIAFTTGVKPKWLVQKSMALFAQEVMPKFRAADGKPVVTEEDRIGYSSAAEYGARRPTDAPRPTAIVDGRRVDVTESYLPGRLEPVV